MTAVISPRDRKSACLTGVNMSAESLRAFLDSPYNRYLCPYGALLGLVSWMSPAKIRRDPVSCIDCGLCDKVCMASQPVSRKLSIWSPECTSCLDCVAVCPIKDASVPVAHPGV